MWSRRLSISADSAVALLDLAGLDAGAAAQVDTLAQQKAEEAIGQAHLILQCRDRG